MKRFLVTILAAALALTLAVGVFASTGDVQKTLSYNNIKITLNGNTITPKDANGNAVEPFIIDGTTYLPVRAVAEALGLDVQWDGETKTVKLGEKSSNATESTTPAYGNTESYKISDTHFEYFTNSIGNIEYRGIVEITNTGNTDLYLKDCVFDLEDNNGHLLQSDSFISNCPDVIKPGEKGYFYNGLGSLYINDDVSLENGIKFSPQVTVVKATGTTSNYETSDTELRQGTFGPTVTGRVKNSTNEDNKMLYVCVVYFDKNGKAIGITGTTITDFSAGKTSSFEIGGMALSESVTLDSIANYKIIAQKTYYQF